MLKQIAAAGGVLIFTATLASAGPKRPTPNQTAINRLQADIKRDEAALAAAQRAGNAAGRDSAGDGERTRRGVGRFSQRTQRPARSRPRHG